MLTQEKFKTQINNAIFKAGLKKESLKIALKGAFKEYLFADDKDVYIYKDGFMTGHLFGSNVYKLPYKNISSVNVNYHLMSGYFEISAGGVQSKQASYWSNDSSTDPAKMPNAISLSGKDQADVFRKAIDVINESISGLSNNQNNNQTTNDTTDEIRKYKELLDDGIITQEEFNNKKKQLLNL